MRCTIIWIKQGGDNTKNSRYGTERFHSNSIAMLKDKEGNEVSDDRR
jgi:hypothetical protein